MSESNHYPVFHIPLPLPDPLFPSTAFLLLTWLLLLQRLSILTPKWIASLYTIYINYVYTSPVLQYTSNSLHKVLSHGAVSRGWVSVEEFHFLQEHNATRITWAQEFNNPYWNEDLAIAARVCRTLQHRNWNPSSRDDSRVHESTGLIHGTLMNIFTSQSQNIRREIVGRISWGPKPVWAPLL